MLGDCSAKLILSKGPTSGGVTEITESDVIHLSGCCQPTSSAHLFCSWEEVPSLPSLPSLASCFATSYPGTRQHFGSASLASQKGTREQNLANPICSSLLVNSAQEKAVQTGQLEYANSENCHDTELP